MHHCQIAPKLVTDNAGTHLYKMVCRRCYREYGEEFEQPHFSTMEIARSQGRTVRCDPIPKIQPQLCTSLMQTGCQSAQAA
jgi:hypothetical protein